MNKVKRQKMDTTEEEPRIVEVRRSSEWYKVNWKDGYTGRYPFVWLRDNCRCPLCYYPSSKQRCVLLCDIDVEMEPESEEIIDNGEELKIYWPDKHVSPFPSRWLYHNRFDKTQYDSVKDIKPKPWGSEMIDQLPKFDYKKVMEDSRVLRDCLRSLIVSGIAVLTGAPKEQGVTEEIGKRVGHLRTTMYGKTFEVLAIASSSNLAYTTLKLGLHVDLPLYEIPPSIQMLHCIKQCETIGGESQFCDAMKVTNDLKESDPEFYDTLTRVKVDFRLRGKDFIPYHYQHARPIIELDEKGEFKAISHNNAVRAPYMNIPVEEVKNFYKSLAYLDRKLNDKENMIQFKLKEGEVVIFNNNRAMHGRSSFRMAQGYDEGKKTRHLEGGYLQWDVVKSAIRLLDEELDDITIH
nr:gamma-butyrobetaine dioxygenase-like [Lytechinus pictus]